MRSRAIPLRFGIMTQIATYEFESKAGRNSGPRLVVRATAADWDGLQARREDWMALFRQTIEPDIFADPLFVTASLQHLSRTRHPQFILTHAPDGQTLTGVFPVQVPRRGFGVTARLWSTPMMANGALLVDEAMAGDALRQFFAWIGAHHPHVKSVIFPALKRAGALARALRETMAEAGLRIHETAQRSRAIVSRDLWTAGAASSKPCKGKLREFQRLRRRLCEQGELKYVSAQTPNELRPAMERFLSLEAAGWKGKRGTALLCDPSLATFARALVRHIARRGRCRIDCLELDGKAIAMGIVLSAGGKSFYWKTCYDEAFARFSPGVLFSLEMTQEVFASGAIVIDSCAIEGHPMIDHLWREREEIADFIIATPVASATAFRAAVNVEDGKRAARKLLKSAWYFLRGRKAS